MKAPILFIALGVFFIAYTVYAWNTYLISGIGFVFLAAIFSCGVVNVVVGLKLIEKEKAR